MNASSLMILLVCKSIYGSACDTTNINMVNTFTNEKKQLNKWKELFNSYNVSWNSYKITTYICTFLWGTLYEKVWLGFENIYLKLTFFGLMELQSNKDILVPNIINDLPQNVINCYKR